MNRYLGLVMYYHGTSDKLAVGKSILPPSKTGIITESTRLIRLDKVFFTTDEKYALIYAHKACLKFGGNPVVFSVVPFGEIECINSTKGCTVFCADSLTINGGNNETT